MACYDVLAGIDADVSEAGAEAAQLGAPAPFSGADVKHGSQLAAEEVFSRTDDHAHLSANRVRGMHPGSRIAVPFFEVGFIVRFAAGLRRQLGGHHAVVQR